MNDALNFYNMIENGQYEIEHIPKEINAEEKKCIAEFAERLQTIAESLTSPEENQPLLIELTSKIAKINNENSLKILHHQLDEIKKCLLEIFPNLGTLIKQKKEDEAFIAAAKNYYPAEADNLSASAEKARNEIIEKLCKLISSGEYERAILLGFHIVPLNSQMLRGKSLELATILFKKLLETKQLTTAMDYFKDDILAFLLRGMENTLQTNKELANDIIFSISQLPNSNLQATCFSKIVSALENEKKTNIHKIVFLLLKNGANPKILLRAISNKINEHPKLIRLFIYFGERSDLNMDVEVLEHAIEARNIYEQAIQEKAAQTNSFLKTLTEDLKIAKVSSKIIQEYDSVVDLCLARDPILNAKELD